MKQSQQPGFILLFAVLLVSIVLTVTLVLLDITLRQLVLSAINRDSQKAYYAAYAGIDCAVYWDRDYPSNISDTVKPFGSYTSSAQPPENPATLECGFDHSVPDGSPAAILLIAFADGSCASVTVTKSAPSGNDGDTVIISNGYNLGDATSCPANTNQARLVERTLRTTYNDNWK